MLKKNNHYTSPNFEQRPLDIKIDTIIIHYTEMKDDISALERLCDKEAKVSAHYLINKQGIIFALVPENLRAWHAGVSCWKGRDKVNDFSIGIELDNNGNEEFAPPLMNSLITLCQELIKTHPINPFYILGHSDIAPARKADPGRYFNWKILAENNIGIYPNDPKKAVISSASSWARTKPEIGDLVRKSPEISDRAASRFARDDVPSVHSAIRLGTIPDIKTIQTMLVKYGYKLEITGIIDQDTLDVMKAFNEHFNQQCFEPWNENSQAALNELTYLMRE